MEELKFPRNLAHDLSHHGYLGNELQIMQALPKLILEISQKNQKVIFYKYKEKLTEEQIAEKLETSEMRVKQMLDKAIRYMRAAMIPYHFQPDNDAIRAYEELEKEKKRRIAAEEKARREEIARLEAEAALAKKKAEEEERRQEEEFDEILRIAQSGGEDMGEVKAFIGMDESTPLESDLAASLMEAFNSGKDITDEISSKAEEVKSDHMAEEIPVKEFSPIRVFNLISHGAVIHALCKEFGSDTCTDVLIYDRLTKYIRGEAKKIPGIGYKYLVNIFDCLKAQPDYHERYEDIDEYLKAVQQMNPDVVLPEMLSKDFMKVLVKRDLS